ncbi:hypothetical protein P8452_05524 [Trifolium repens]|nr:hypothetical protein P8452_05524 [Trifolium repens]
MFELEFEVLNLQFSCVHVMLQKATGLVEEDETEQLKASVDYLVELCETVSPVDDSKFANLAHQSVEFILGIISLQ